MNLLNNKTKKRRALIWVITNQGINYLVFFRITILDITCDILIQQKKRELRSQ